MRHKRKCIEKRRYGTLLEAKAVTKRMYQTLGLFLDVYECPLCLDFHLTKQRTELGCLLYRKLEGEGKRKRREKVIKEKPKYILLKKRKKRSRVVYVGRVPTANLIQHNYALMRRHLRGLLPKVKSTLKGTLPLQEQRKLLATLNT